MRNGHNDSQKEYINSLTPETSPLFVEAKQNSELLGKESISLGIGEGRILSLLMNGLAGQFGAIKFVEIGCLTGYSALWILDGMKNQGGKLWTLEKDENHAEMAESVLQKWKGKASVQVVCGDARKTLKEIESQGPFHGVFIDGNKAAYLDYLDWSEKNVIKGGLIVADNVFLRGSVYDSQVESPFSHKQVEVMQVFNKRLTQSDKYISAFIPTHDGLLAAYKQF